MSGITDFRCLDSRVTTIAYRVELFGTPSGKGEAIRFIDVIWVGLGGGLGTVGRWWIGRAVGERNHGDFPVGTFLINISGAFVIGYLSVLFEVDWRDRYGTALNSLVLTGVLGGYTTFSSMQLDAARLAEKKRSGLAAFYLLASVATGLLAAILGAALARVQG